MAITTDNGALVPTTTPPQQPQAALGNFNGNLGFTPIVGPSVVTSKAASNSLADITTKTADINTGIQNQAAKTAAANAPVATPASPATPPQETPKPTQTPKAATPTGQPAGTTVTSLPNGVQAYYDSAKQTLTTTDGKALTYNNVQGAWIDPATGQPPILTPIVGQGAIGPIDANGNPVLSDQADRQALAQAQAEYQTQATQVQNTITNIQNGTIPLNAGEQAQVDGLKQQFQALIDQQALTNTGATGQAQVRGYQTGAAEYDPSFQVKTIGSIVTAGQNKISDLMTKEASAVATLTQALKDNDIKAVQSAWTVYQDASKARTDAIQKVITDAGAAIKDAQEKKIAADKVIYDTVTKPIQDVALEAAKSGAPADVQKAISSAQTVGDAIKAGGLYMQTSTNPDVAQYLFYEQQSTTAGIVPKSYDDWQKAQAALANSLAYSKAYATASGSAAGTASVVGQNDTPADVGPTSAGGSILSATGLSYGAFLVLTGDMSKLSRDAATRNAAMKQAQEFANKAGVDVSTLSSRYQALNKVVSFNTVRQSMAVVQENEIQATIKNLENVSPTGSLSNLNFANVAKIWAGQQVNDPTAQQYAFHLEQLRNEMVAYNLIAQGQINPDGSLKQADAADMNRVDSVLKNGVSSGSLSGLETSVTNSTNKMKPVLQSSVDSANKAVWGLFGVEDKYSSNKASANSQLLLDSKAQEQAVTSGLKAIQTSNPKLYQAASTMFTSVNPSTNQPYTAEDILQAFPELQQ